MKELKYDATYKLGNTTVNIVAPKNQTKEEIDQVLKEYHIAGRAIVKELQEREYESLKKGNKKVSLINTLIERTKKLKAGDKITVTLEGYFGGFHMKKVTVAEDGIMHDGYIIPDGGWCLSKTDGEDKIECYVITVRPYRKRYLVDIKIEFHLKDFKYGWED